MNFYEQNYRLLLKKIINNGYSKSGRNGGTRYLFGETLRLRGNGGAGGAGGAGYGIIYYRAAT